MKKKKKGKKNIFLKISKEQRKLFIEEANEEEETRETAPLSILISSWKNVRPF